MGTVCVEAEQKNDKQNNQIRLQGLLTIREYLEEGKLIVGGASVACVVPLANMNGFWHHAGYCRRLLVLPDTFTYYLQLN